MTLMIDNRQDAFETSKIEAIIKTVVDKALEYENKDKNVEVSAVLVDNEEIRKLNRDFRGIDRATDVLSFPMLEYGEQAEDKDEEVNMDTGEIVLGDIVISLERAKEQACEYGHSFEREIAFLTVHGMLHLLGYDHIDEGDRKVMRQHEEGILEILNIRR